MIVDLRLVACAAFAVAACGRESPAPPTAMAAAATGSSDGGPGIVPATPLAPCPVERASLGAELTVERWPIEIQAGSPACLDLVRAPPSRYALRVLSASDEAGARTAPAWRDAFHLTAVINAGMFHASGTPVGLVVGDGVEQSRDNAKMSGYLAWDPVSAADPPVAIWGRACPGFDLAALRDRYHSVVQSYRLLGCAGEALPWKDPKPSSAAGIAVDRDGRIVLFHVRTPVTMPDLAATLAARDLTGALFLEGGPEASLVARGPDGDLARAGTYETGLAQDHTFWTLPNAIALFPR